MYYLEYDLKIGIFIFVGIIISTIRLMSYTDEINVNPHIYIYAKSLNKNQSAEVDLKKIEYLSKTRLLDDLLKES